MSSGYNILPLDLQDNYLFYNILPPNESGNYLLPQEYWVSYNANLKMFIINYCFILSYQVEDIINIINVLYELKHFFL